MRGDVKAHMTMDSIKLGTRQSLALSHLRDPPNFVVKSSRIDGLLTVPLYVQHAGHFVALRVCEILKFEAEVGRELNNSAPLSNSLGVDDGHELKKARNIRCWQIACPLRSHDVNISTFDHLTCVYGK